MGPGRSVIARWQDTYGDSVQFRESGRSRTFGAPGIFLIHHRDRAAGAVAKTRRGGDKTRRSKEFTARARNLRVRLLLAS